ncbi:MAG: FliH/SctL family protein [Candidatus Puniceispirillaceae bacterium]
MAQVAETYLSEEQQVVGENRLADAEIARLLKTVQAAQFIKSETMPAETDSTFKPRSLVEIAFEAEKKRQEEAARAEAVEKAARQAAQEVLQPPMSEEAMSPPAGDPSPQPETDRFSDPMTEAASAGQAMGTADQPDAQHDAQYDAGHDAAEQAGEEAGEQARLQREAEDAQLRAEAEEEGYKKGFESGLEAARSAEPTEEEKAIAAAREAERTEIISRLEAVIVAAAGTEAVDVSALAPAIEEAVLRLASERAGLAIQENPQGLVQRIEQLIEKVKSSASAICVTLNPEDLKAVEAWRSAQNAYPNWVWRADTQLVSGDIKLKLDGISVSDVLGLEAKAQTDMKVEEPAERALEENLVEDATVTEDVQPMETEAGNIDETETDQAETDQAEADQTETQATLTEESEAAEIVAEASAEVEKAEEVQPEEASLRDKAEDAIGEGMAAEKIGSASQDDEQSP